MPGVAELHLEEEREPGAGVAETEERRGWLAEGEPAVSTGRRS